MANEINDKNNISNFNDNFCDYENFNDGYYDMAYEPQIEISNEDSDFPASNKNLNFINNTNKETSQISTLPKDKGKKGKLKNIEEPKILKDKNKKKEKKKDKKHIIPTKKEFMTKNRPISREEFKQDINNINKVKNNKSNNNKYTSQDSEALDSSLENKAVDYIRKPDFNNFSEDKIKEMIKEYGLRPSSNKNMIKLLCEIWDFVNLSN